MSPTEHSISTASCYWNECCNWTC